MGDGDQPSTRGVHQVIIGRRRALAVFGGVAAGVTLAPRSALAAPARIAPPAAAAPDLAFQVIRVQDMLNLGFQFYNAHTVVKNGQTYVAVTDPSQPAYLVVVFPPQHHGEETGSYNPDSGIWSAPPLHDALAGPSWLAFELPADASIPFTAAGLLAWHGLTAQLVPVVSDPGSAPAAPDPLHSALEVPWSLWLSPPVGGTWHHSAAPVTAGGRTELWHTRLGVGGAEPPSVTPPITAFWSATYGSAGPTGQPPSDPWPMSLNPVARDDIVALSCSVIPGGGPAQASLLALSALGASLSVQGAWSPGPTSGVSLAQWSHRASTGRDSYVRVADRKSVV